MNRALLIGVSVLGAFSLAGCGSGGGGAIGGSGGAAAMTLRWPASVAGVLPRDTQSVRVTLFKFDEQTEAPPERIAGPKLVTRPQNPTPGPARIVFDDLPPGLVRVEVSAHGTSDGSDTPCAIGFGQGTIEAGRRTPISVEMQNTTYRLDVQPTGVQLAPGATRQFTAKALDINNRTLLGITFVWRSTDPSVATVDPFTGLVTAVAKGSAEIVAQEEFGAFEARAPVSVQ